VFGGKRKSDILGRAFLNVQTPDISHSFSSAIRAIEERKNLENLSIPVNPDSDKKTAPA
jgi:hypothetical protein